MQSFPFLKSMEDFLFKKDTLKCDNATEQENELMHLQDPTTKNNTFKLHENFLPLDFEWERLLATRHGLLKTCQATIKHKEDQFSDMKPLAQRIQEDAPNDACNFFLIEEHACIKNALKYKKELEAPTQCIKWFTEWIQCQWDQEKFNKGINFIEPLKEKKRRSYYSAPQYRYG